MRYPSGTENATPSAGWSERSLAGSIGIRHLALVRLKERLIQEFDSAHALCALSNTSFDVEVLKSAVRSLIRYSGEAKQFTVELIRELIAINGSWGDFYVTPPYLIFHLPNDRNEVGTIHLDTIRECNGMFTCWTPINDRQLHYPALTFYQGSHTPIRGFAYRAFRKLKLSRWLPEESFLALTGASKINLVPRQGSSYFWDSNLLHIGNLNVDARSHCSIVYRVCNTPLYYEPANRCASMASVDRDETFSPSLSELTAALDILCSLAKAAPNLLTFNQDARDWVLEARAARARLSEVIARHCSFALALIGQRFDGQPFAAAFYLLSFIVGKENLIGIERFLQRCSNAESVDSYLKLVDEFEPMSSFQERMLLWKLQKGRQQPPPVFDLKQRLLTWH